MPTKREEVEKNKNTSKGVKKEQVKTPKEDVNEKSMVDEAAKKDEETSESLANKLLKEEVEKNKKLEDQLKEAAIVQVQENKVKLVKVKFIENHTYNRGVEKIFAKVGDITQVEPHLANKFVQRKLAYILG